MLAERITRGVQNKPLRTVLYGVEAVGKSSFAAQFPKPIFLAAEDGTSAIDTARIVPNDWVDAINIMSELLNDESGEFQTINIDTLGWLCELAAKNVCDTNRVQSLGDIPYGNWKRLMFDEFQKFMGWMRALYAKGYNINIIAHANISTFKNPEGEDFDRYSIALTFKDIADEMKQWVDMVGFFNYDTTIVETQDGMRKVKKPHSNNARRLYLNRSAAFDAKNRFGLPDFIDLGQSPEAGFERFWTAYEQCRGNLAGDAALSPAPTPPAKPRKTKPAKPTPPTKPGPAVPPIPAAPPIPT